jgi:L-amino acid N-acyltransferase YncA
VDFRAAREGDIPAILRLQRENLEAAVPAGEARDQGFVTVVHDEATLRHMHALAPSVVAEVDGVLAGYALTMLSEARSFVPVLQPMFAQLDRLELGRFYVRGQICVGKPFRGSGVFDALYQGHRELYQDRFAEIVTEIALRNTRSMRAHERVGFRVVHRYRDATDDWAVVAWDFGRGK